MNNLSDAMISIWDFFMFYSVKNKYFSQYILGYDKDFLDKAVEIHYQKVSQLLIMCASNCFWIKDIDIDGNNLMVWVNKLEPIKVIF